MKNLQSFIVMLILCVAGLGLVGWGAAIKTHDTIWSPLLMAFGGTFFGVASSIVLSWFKQINLLNLLENSLNACFRSFPDVAPKFKRKFYQYHLTQVKSEATWRCIVLDFSQSSEVGTLNARVKTTDPEGELYFSDAEAGIRGERFIILRNPDSGESPVVSVFPYMAKGILTYHAGLSIMESWKMNPIITRTIIGTKPVLGWENCEKGEVPEEVSVECDRIWSENFSSSFDLMCAGTNKPPEN